MALHKIDIALGPEATLNALSEKYPERGFLKYRSTDDHRKFMLLDVSDEKTVFQSGLNYKVMQSGMTGTSALLASSRTLRHAR